MATRLNLGCGRDIRPAAEGWVNMDIVPLAGVDVVHDLLQFPWPFADGQFDHVHASHVLEHVPHDVGDKQRRDGFLLVMEELHRVLRPGGRLEIFSPHPSSEGRWADPTHTRVIQRRNFDYFQPDGPWAYYTPARFRVLESGIIGRTTSLPDWLPLGKSGLGLTEHLATRLSFLSPLLKRRPRDIRLLVERL